jgi:hypothetical protein
VEPLGRRRYVGGNETHLLFEMGLGRDRWRREGRWEQEVSRLDWHPITRKGKPEVRDVHPQYPDRLDVVIRLSEKPPDEWVHFFVHGHTDSPRVPWLREASTPIPRVEGVSVRIAPRDEELPEWVAALDGRIEEANEFYTKTVLPASRARDQALDVADEERNQRVNEARRRAEGL